MTPRPTFTEPLVLTGAGDPVTPAPERSGAGPAPARLRVRTARSVRLGSDETRLTALVAGVAEAARPVRPLGADL